jgi:hypothetical protein
MHTIENDVAGSAVLPKYSTMLLESLRKASFFVPVRVFVYAKISKIVISILVTIYTATDKVPTDYSNTYTQHLDFQNPVIIHLKGSLIAEVMVGGQRITGIRRNAVDWRGETSWALSA